MPHCISSRKLGQGESSSIQAFNSGLQHETKCKDFKMSQQKIKGLSKKYCHPEFISASIESRHAERGCLQPISASIEHRHAERGCLQPNSASLVQGRFRVRPGMTASHGFQSSTPDADSQQSFKRRGILPSAQKKGPDSLSEPCSGTLRNTCFQRCPLFKSAERFRT